MHRRAPWFLGIVIVLLLFFIFFMPTVGTRLRGLIGPQAASLGDAGKLAAENLLLKAQLAELSAIASEMPTSTPDSIRAMVYSDYPFNFKNELTVDVGSRDGVATRDAALFEGNLVGEVVSVSSDRSVVRTVFDPSFVLYVRIGTKGYDAFLVGGPYPAVQSIAKTADLAAGDAVYSADDSMPYAIAVGKVADVSISSNNVFKQASLAFPYDVGVIQTLEIVR